MNGLKIALCLVLVFSMSGCADHVSFEQASAMIPVGFWFGIWHGMILPFSWIASWFSSDVAIYAIYNNGGMYDAGFVLGAGSISFTLKCRL